MPETPYQPPSVPPAMPDGAEPGPDDRNMAMLCHLLGIITGDTLGMGFLGPLILWLIKKDQSRFVDFHGKEALNFQLTVLLVLFVGGIIAFILTFVIIGIFLFILLGIVALLALIPEILACIAASRGEWYRYPCSIRFIQ
jgi:uncharacterized Tic20 family protein